MSQLVRFVLDGNTACPATRRLLAQRVPSRSEYRFDRGRIREVIQTVVRTIAQTQAIPHLTIAETYSLNRYCVAVHSGPFNSLILDYGFVELLADSIGLEYLSNNVIDLMTRWSHAGRPPIFDWEEDPGSFVMDEVEYQITGSMMVRDLASKFVEDIVPDPVKRNRILIKLLWPTEGGSRPNAVFFEHLVRDNTNVLPQPQFSTNIHYQVELITTFIACHELWHLASAPETFDTWTKVSRYGPGTTVFFECLVNMPLPVLGGESVTAAQVMKYALDHPAVKDRAQREAVIDIHALNTLLQHQISVGTIGSERWNGLLANIFVQIALANSLIIFRNHMAASIRNRRVDGPDIHLARGEAVLRNCLVLAYMLCFAAEIIGQRDASALISQIQPEYLHLFRRFSFFQMDITNGVEGGEDGWQAFIEAALV
jgi:hypothetical protein